MNPILFVVHGLPPQEMGGVELYSYAYAKHVASQRPVAFFTHRIADVRGVLVEDHVRENMPVREVVTSLGWIQDVCDVYENTLFAKPFRQWVEQLEPEEIHFQHTIRLSPELIEEALRFGIPVRVTLHDFFYICPRVHRFRPHDEQPCYSHRHRLDCMPCLQQWYWETRSSFRGWWDLQRIFRSLEKMLHKVDFLEAPSHFVAQVFKHFGYQRPIQVKPLGLIHQPNITDRVETERYSPQNGNGYPMTTPRERSKESDRPFTFGYIGGYLHYKGIELVLDAFLELRRCGYKVQLRLFGVARDHDYIHKLKSKTPDLSQAIHWGGEFPPEELPQILNTMDALVIPSLCEETYSFAAREALAFGLPVIGADSGALPEVLAGLENCQLFKRGDVYSLAKAMGTYL